LRGQVLAYAAAGWPVFPCKPDAGFCPQPGGCSCKAPLTRNGFHDATTDPGVIRQWWRRWPAANVAIATGAPGPDVLDVDVSTEGSGWAAFNRAKAVGLLSSAHALVRTPRGGLHAYYRGSGQPCGSLTRAGHFVDFKASGGYVLAPPSRVHGKPYELVDHRNGDGRLDWQAVRQLLDPPRRTAARLPADGDVTRLAAWVAGQPEGNRNRGLYWAALRINGDPGAADLLVAAAVQAGLPEAEARRTVTSAAGRADR
jgi:Bifunctional DNA primase/polymerase, N-terminal